MRTIGILIVALFLALATCGNAFASGGHRGGHKPESVTKDDGKNKNDKKHTKKKKRNKRKHHHRAGSPP